VAGGPVQPIPPERQELFAEEESIGRIPIEQAFQHLADLEPRLLDVKRQAEAPTSAEHSQECGLSKPLRQQLHGLIGGGASAEHELLHGSLATSIVHQYLGQLTGSTRFGSPALAYFDTPTKHVVMTGSFGGPRSTKR
jgi:hypothetical protein